MHNRYAKGHRSSSQFHRTARPHPMNQVVSFVQGHGLFRGGVQV